MSAFFPHPSVLWLDQKLFQSAAFFSSSIFFLKTLFKNIHFGIPSLQSSSCYSFTKPFVWPPLYLSYLNSVENAHFPQITGTPLIKFPSKGKGISSAGLALCLRKSCFPGDSFNLLQKVRKLNQLLCLLVHLPLYSSYPKPTNLLALFIMYDTSF